MAKNKVRTHKGASKRFKVTSTGKVLHRSHTIRHLRGAKSKRQVRKLMLIKQVTSKQSRTIKRLLGLA